MLRQGLSTEEKRRPSRSRAEPTLETESGKAMRLDPGRRSSRRQQANYECGRYCSGVYSVVYRSYSYNSMAQGWTSTDPPLNTGTYPAKTSQVVKA